MAKLKVTSSRAGEPVAWMEDPLHIPVEGIRVSNKGTVFVYCTLPVVVCDDNGKPLLRTAGAGSLILRAAPILGGEEGS